MGCRIVCALLTSFMLVGGSLGDIYGRKRIFIAGVFVFAAASVWCGLASSVSVLIACAGLQGIGGALLVPGSLAITWSVFLRE